MKHLPVIPDIALGTAGISGDTFAWKSKQDGLYRIYAAFPLGRLPQQRDLFYSTMVSINGKPPVKTKFPLFKGMQLVNKRASLLKIKGITVDSFNDPRYARYGDCLVVGVNFHYVGNKPLSVRTGSEYRLWGVLDINRTFVPSRKGEIRLFSDWSPRVVDDQDRVKGHDIPLTKATTTIGSSWTVLPAVSSYDVEYDEATQMGKIYYRIYTKCFSKSPSPQTLRLKAAIGLDGDGFLPFSVLIREKNGVWISTTALSK